MMKDNKTGPFKKGIEKKAEKLNIHSLWVALALTFIALSQIPIAVHSTLDILYGSTYKANGVTKVLSCE